MKKTLFITTFMLAACAPAQTTEPQPQTPAPSSSITDTAIFAGGCFWCVESDFEKLPGVITAVSGYTGGRTENPTYKQVTNTNTGHYEAVKITFDPAVVTYPELVEYFWRKVDPTDPTGQFCDKGESYRTAIFARADQMRYAAESKENLIQNKPFAAPIVTPVLETSEFYDAEEYHQDYYIKNKLRYNYYRKSCGRDNRLKQLWGE